MTPCILRLKRRVGEPRKASAWFMAGGDPAVWLEELCRWGTPEENMRLFMVPRSRKDRAAGGLLVIPPAGSPAPREPRALALAILEGNLYLPIDADLHPPTAAGEAIAHGDAAVTLFHPGAGLIEFRAEDALRVADLLEAPPLRLADWNSARAGSVLDSTLAGITLLAPLDPGELFGDARKEIGSEPWGELPERPGEPSSGALDQIGRKLTGLGAAAVEKAFSMLPKTAKGRTWINDVLDWAAAKRAGISREMEEMRHRELHRLMSLLESDPERGLRHALPFAGGAGRGRARPGGRLGPRDPNFNVGRLGGGAPMDPWSVPPDLRRKMMTRYRELALREQQLGRFRRAAYIHAELLGDLSAAAAVLVEGKLFGEAALLYRDHLHQSRVAAECFVEGGLFLEAIAIYEKDRAFLELGDLLRTIGRTEAAADAYRRAVEEKVAALDFVAAAGLLETKLDSPDEALALLAKGWPHSQQAVKCLEEEFLLLAKLARHDAARRKVESLRNEATPDRLAIPLARILSARSKTYPDPTIRNAAADVVRIKVSGRLSLGDAEEARAGVTILSDLFPQDRLLARDASRFLAARLEALARRGAPEPVAQPRKSGSGRVLSTEFVGQFTIPNTQALLSIEACGQDFIAAIRQRAHPTNLTLVRGKWSATFQSVDWSSPVGTVERVALVLDELSTQPDYVVPLCSPQFVTARKTLPAEAAFHSPLHLTAPAWLPRGIVAMSISEGQWRLLRGLPNDFILETRGEDGRLIGSLGLTSLLVEIGEPIEHVSILALRNHVWLAFDQHLFLIDGEKTPKHWECESPILGLEPSAPFLARAAVARCLQGVAVFWSDHPSAEPEILALEIAQPLVTFTRNGLLAVLSTRAGPQGFAGVVIDVDRRGVQSTLDFVFKGPAPAALLATYRADQFAVVTHNGEVHIVRVKTAPK